MYDTLLGSQDAQPRVPKTRENYVAIPLMPAILGPFDSGRGQASENLSEICESLQGPFRPSLFPGMGLPSYRATPSPLPGPQSRAWQVSGSRNWTILSARSAVVNSLTFRTHPIANDDRQSVLCASGNYAVQCQSVMLKHEQHPTSRRATRWHH